MLRSIPGELRPAANPEGSVSTRILRIAEVFALDWMERDDYEYFGPYQDVFKFAISREGMGCRVSEARSYAEGFDEAPGLDYFYRFEQAFRVARSSGKSRSDAEDFAYNQL